MVQLVMGNGVMVNKQLLFSAELRDENQEVESLCVIVQKEQHSRETFSRPKNAFGCHFAPEKPFRQLSSISDLAVYGSFSDMGNNVLLS